jgi:integron integrase
VSLAWEKATDEMQRDMLLKRYSTETVRSYLGWVDRFWEYTKDAPLDSLGPPDVKNYLTHIALQLNVSASTQNQAFNALLFLFRHVLKRDFSGFEDTVRARRRQNLPTVLSKDEVRRVLGNMWGTSRLMALLVYGSGIRVNECVQLRVQDLDFAQKRLIVRSGKGAKDRTTLLPKALFEPLQKHLARVKELHARDLAQGYGEVFLPDAIARKYPNASKEWPWQYVFPSTALAFDYSSGKVRRFYTAKRTIQRAVADAARIAGITKRVGVHSLRHYPESRTMPRKSRMWAFEAGAAALLA